MCRGLPDQPPPPPCPTLFCSQKGSVGPTESSCPGLLSVPQKRACVRDLVQTLDGCRRGCGGSWGVIGGRTVAHMRSSDEGCYVSEANTPHQRPTPRLKPAFADPPGWVLQIPGKDLRRRPSQIVPPPGISAWKPIRERLIHCDLPLSVLQLRNTDRCINCSTLRRWWEEVLALSRVVLPSATTSTSLLNPPAVCSWWIVGIKAKGASRCGCPFRPLSVTSSCLPSVLSPAGLLSFCFISVSLFGAPVSHLSLSLSLWGFCPDLSSSSPSFISLHLHLLLPLHSADFSICGRILNLRPHLLRRSLSLISVPHFLFSSLPRVYSSTYIFIFSTSLTHSARLPRSLPPSPPLWFQYFMRR